MRGAHLDMLKQPEARHVATSDWEKKTSESVWKMMKRHLFKVTT